MTGQRGRWSSMRKTFYLSLIASAVLSASEPVELFGEQVDMNDTTVSADGNPVAVYQDQVLSADQIVYDRNASVITAKGSVNVSKARQYKLLSDMYRIDLTNDRHYAKPYYMLDQQEGAWISANEAEGCDSSVNLESGMVSGCDSADPLWVFRFSSGDYDRKNAWVNLYNVRLKMGNIPVFYLPYFGYPTDRTRRSGLLPPKFGLSSTEGFFYQQPIYFAPTNWWDLEIRPQIRTARGYGTYADLRFIDTPSSEGTIRVGYFKEDGDYAIERNLKNDQHYGYALHYEHKAPLREWFNLKSEGDSGLYVDGLWMNDVDYKNLQHTNQTLNVTSKQVISRINGFYNAEDEYVGMYVKHYQYLDLPTNAQTIQTLPSFQYHRYLQSFYDNRLLINADATATNFYRQDGKNAVEGNVKIPLMFHTRMWDDILDLSYTAGLSAKTIGFYGNLRSDEADNRYETGMYAKLDHSLAVSSSLVRPFGEMTHVLNPFVNYTVTGNRIYKGYYDTYRDSCDPTDAQFAGAPCDYFGLVKPANTLSLGVNNYFFEKGEYFLTDRLSQNFYYDDIVNSYGELQNEFEWQINDSLSFYNKTAYNHDQNRITKEQNTLRYNHEGISANVNHYYTNAKRYDSLANASYWTADASYEVNSNLQVFGLVAYDGREDLFKRREIGFLHKQRCLDFGLRFVQNRRPILTYSNVNSVDESYIFFTINLKPMGGSEFNYKLTKK